jgi:hypothetical protein
MNNILFGTDPEYFICEKINGEDYSVPVPHFIENLGVNEVGYDETRKHPKIISTPEFNVIMDGVAAECNFTPSKTPKEMYTKCKNAIDAINEVSTKFGYSVVLKPTVKYDFYKWFKPESDLFRQCGIFGCDPDEDAIMPDYNSPELDVASHEYRYGGGHLHMSDNNGLLKEHPYPMIRLLAITVGNFCIANSPYPDLEKLRAFKYGQPGRFRIQHYKNNIDGIEYRSPSNVWTTKLDLTEGVFDWANKAYEYLKNPEKAIDLMRTYMDSTIDAIGNVNQTLSQSILSNI